MPLKYLNHNSIFIVGAALPIHILSYVQSVMLIKSPSPIPQAELNDEKVDFAHLNTNEILQRARYVSLSPKKFVNVFTPHLFSDIG